jgi:2,3-bisphosphoglycerate-independent phosphoglycerate mutase
MNKKKVILMILDGWGVGKKDKADAIYNGDTPNMDRFIKNYPNSNLLSDGENVGLPDGQMGNSEVGHLNIGAGRIVYQDLVKINKAIKDNSIAENSVLTDAFRYAKEQNKSVHFIGLLSPGGVHSMDTHLYKLCDMTGDFGLDKVFIHALTDGRDVDPKSGKGYTENLLNHLQNSNGQLATLVGRYYTMDRDKRWERVKEGYDLIVKGKGTTTRDMVQSIQNSYDAGITDEFIKPLVSVDGDGKAIGVIEEDDVVICFNFRTDRLREISTVLTQKDMPEYKMQSLPLHYLTMTRYDDSFKNVHIVFDKENVRETLGEVVADNGLKQIRIAETEKYAHVTFFFSGGREAEFENEKRILIPSPKVATYDLQPEMSALLVKEAILKELSNGETDFICLNFANGDMVGHTGDYKAILQAVNTVDTCVGEVVDSALANDYTPIIIADHGNADNAVNDDGSINTAHSMNPVPCILVSEQYSNIENGVLADIAPTILKIMGLDQPEAMTGRSLV